MLRRSFLQTMVGGIAAAAAVRTFPFRVYSFPKELQLTSDVASIRFVRAFDPFQCRMINRFDALCGWYGQLQAPMAVEEARVLSAPSGQFLSRAQVLKFEKECREHFADQLGLSPDGIVEHFVLPPIQEGKPMQWQQRYVELPNA